MRLFLKKITHITTNFFIFVLLFVINDVSGSEFLHFNYLSSRDGLSQNTINAIFKDSRGFIWIGTNDGLNKYNGKEFIIYRKSETGNNSIGNNLITSLAEDNNGRIWIGTLKSGLNIYFPEKDSFALLNNTEHNTYQHKQSVTSLFFNSSDNKMYISYKNGTIDIINTKTLTTVAIKKVKDSLSGLFFSKNISFEKDYYGRIWIGSLQKGLFLLKNITSVPEHVPISAHHNPFKTDDLKEPVRITDLKMIDNKYMAIATYNTGLILFNTLTYEYKQVNLIPEQEKEKGIANITVSLLVVNDSILWISSFLHGIVSYNLNSNTLRYLNSKSKNCDLHSDEIRYLYKDNQGIIWIGTNGYGLYKYSVHNSFFNTFGKTGNKKIKLNFGSVRSIYKTGDNLWAGGYWGINIIDLNKNSIKYIAKDFVPYHFTVLPSDSSALWATVETKHGLLRIDKSSLKPDYIRLGAPDKLAAWYMMVPYDDTYCWISGSNGRLIKYNYRSKKVSRYFNKKKDKNFIEGRLVALMLRKNNELWIGSDNDGIMVIDTETEKTIYRFRANDAFTNDSVDLSGILTFYEDDKNQLWIGTQNGLLQFDDNSNKFTRFTKQEGLPNNTVYGILGDNDGNLWLSTNYGISKFNPAKKTFVNYTIEDGLQDYEFNTSAYYENPSKDFLCFGGINGLTWFNPNKYVTDTINTKVVITDVFLNNKRIKSSSEITFNNEMIIPSNMYNLLIRFAGLNFINPRKIKYRYRLDGAKWINLGHDNELLLGFIGYGDHKLEINASNTDGIWSKKITPVKMFFNYPFYLRTWFIVLFLFSLIVIFLSLLYLRTHRLKVRERILSSRIERATKELREKQRELQKEIKEKESIANELRKSNAAKTKLFSIIAHDLISPFNSLLGFTEILNDRSYNLTGDELKEYHQVLWESANKLFLFVQNLLQWSRTQQNKIKPEIENVLLNEITNNVSGLLQGQAKDKQIEIVNNIKEEIRVWADTNLLNTALRNLISNSIKFSFSDSKVYLEARKKQDKVFITISDEGVGMDKDTIANLFDAAKKTKTKGTANEQGTGLGLLIVKEFITLCGGEITVESEPGKGTKFTITLLSG